MKVMYHKLVFDKSLLCYLYNAETLKHVARTVVHVDLSDHVVEVVFTLFDENGKYMFIFTHLNEVAGKCSFPLSCKKKCKVNAHLHMHASSNTFTKRKVNLHTLTKVS